MSLVGADVVATITRLAAQAGAQEAVANEADRVADALLEQAVSFEVRRSRFKQELQKCALLPRTLSCERDAL